LWTQFVANSLLDDISLKKINNGEMRDKCFLHHVLIVALLTYGSIVGNIPFVCAFGINTGTVDRVSHQRKNGGATTRLRSGTKIGAGVGNVSSSSAGTPDLTLFSPSKINLFLRIIRRRPDGFHDLGSLFQTTAFGDVLEFTAHPPGSSECDTMECDMKGVPLDGSNLVMRALALMRARTGAAEGKYFHVNLIKKVPAQGGLGGGSGNAATAMFGFNELLDRPATNAQMVEWSAELGSDITFFLSRGTAYCTGRGEILRPVPPVATSGTAVCIVKPKIGLSTPAVFKQLNYDELSEVDPEDLLGKFLEEGPGTNVENYVNDLEPPAFRVLPELAELKRELEGSGFDRVLMSGSGSSIFCIGRPDDGDAFYERFERRDDVDVFPTHFINRGEGAGDWFEI